MANQYKPPDYAKLFEKATNLRAADWPDEFKQFKSIMMWNYSRGYKSGWNHSIKEPQEVSSKKLCDSCLNVFERES